MGVVLFVRNGTIDHLVWLVARIAVDKDGRESTVVVISMVLIGLLLAVSLTGATTWALAPSKSKIHCLALAMLEKPMGVPLSIRT